jgi:bifunctional ADP-heptose synthase (sugar kinase/adenylyltransferase)
MIPTVLDPKRPSFIDLRDLTLIKPNVREVKSTNLEPGFCSLELEDTYLLNTLGSEGMKLYHNGHLAYSKPALTAPKDVVDVCGCGDTVTAMIGIGLLHYLHEHSMDRIIEMAIQGAHLAIQHRGCHVPPSEYMQVILNKAGINKIAKRM